MSVNSTVTKRAVVRDIGLGFAEEAFDFRQQRTGIAEEHRGLAARKLDEASIGNPARGGSTRFDVIAANIAPMQHERWCPHRRQH